MSARSIRRARERQLERETTRTTRLAKKATVGAGAALGATVLFAPAAEAATFTVTNLNNDGPGSLRQAVEDSNQNNADDVITFASGLSGTIELSNDIEIYDRGLQIQGPGADVITVDANQNGRVFSLYDQDIPDTVVSISGLTLTGGFTYGEGGAIYADDDGDYAPELVLDAVVITGNVAYDDGGGVASDEGSLTITNSAISQNRTVYGSGGGVYVADTDGDQQTEVVVRGSTVSQNRSGVYGSGGGIEIDDSDAATVIENSIFSGNSTGNDGGGILLDDDIGEDGSSAPVTISGTTVSGNTASGNQYNPLYSEGGGIDVDEPVESAVTIENTTVSGNYASGIGGGIRFDTDDDSGAQTVRNSTVVDNRSGDVGGGIAREGFYIGPGANDSQSVTISSTIAANNAPDDLGEDEIDTGDGDFIVGFSLIENPGAARSARLTENPAGSNIFGTDPGLGPLANNGGPTQTHAPTLTSPALDKGIANGLATDQRGLARTQDLSAVPNATGGDGTDIGSVEIQAADCQGQNVPSQTGTEGDDVLTGTDGPDAIFGLGGADTANGLAGNDCVNGDAGRDRLKGQPGNDLVNGGAGKDRASGGGGKDKVKGGAGRDNLKGGGGKDKLKGQGGKDRLKGGGKRDRLSGSGGKDNLKGGGGKDRLKGGKGKDKLRGGGGKDRVNCGGGKDKVFAQPKDKVSANCEKVVTRG